MSAHEESPARLTLKPTSRRIAADRLPGISIFAVYLLLLAAWEYFGRDASPYFSSYPSAIIAASVDLIASGELLTALISSLRSLGLGLLYTLLIGLPLGFLIGRYHLLNRVFGPIITALFVSPREAFVPMLVLWFGLSETARVIFVFLSSVFPMIYNVADGVRNVSSTHVGIARAYGASEWQVTREVTFPATVPFIGIGVKQAIARGLTGLIAAEFFIGFTGLGAALQKASALYRLDRAFVVIFVLVLIGFVLSKLGEIVEARLGAWRRTERAFHGRG